MINNSIESRFAPEDWKSADVSAIHQKESKQILGNLIPIDWFRKYSMQDHEEISQRGTIITHLEVNKLMGDSQLTSYSISLPKWLIQVTDNNKEVNFVHLDFQKAFDEVSTERLMVKVNATGTQGKDPRIGWIRNWLAGSRQQVCINHTNNKFITTIVWCMTR